MIASVNETATDVEICLWVDEDEPDLTAYRALAAESAFPVKIGRPQPGHRFTFSDNWNRAMMLATGHIFMLCADDVVFRTFKWDTQVRQAFYRYNDRLLVAYGRDGIADERMATLPFTSRAWVETVGYFTPSQFVGDYCDLWLHEVAAACGRLVYLPDVYFEHVHPAAGKAPMDDTYAEKIARMEADSTHEVWLASADQRAIDVSLLREALTS